MIPKILCNNNYVYPNIYAGRAALSGQAPFGSAPPICGICGNQCVSAYFNAASRAALVSSDIFWSNARTSS